MVKVTLPADAIQERITDALARSFVILPRHSKLIRAARLAIDRASLSIAIINNPNHTVVRQELDSFRHRLRDFSAPAVIPGARFYPVRLIALATYGIAGRIDLPSRAARNLTSAAADLFDVLQDVGLPGPLPAVALDTIDPTDSLPEYPGAPAPLGNRDTFNALADIADPLHVNLADAIYTSEFLPGILHAIPTGR
jgi:hypothetical protein